MDLFTQSLCHINGWGKSQEFFLNDPVRHQLVMMQWGGDNLLTGGTIEFRSTGVKKQEKGIVPSLWRLNQRRQSDMTFKEGGGYFGHWKASTQRKSGIGDSCMMSLGDAFSLLRDSSTKDWFEGLHGGTGRLLDRRFRRLMWHVKTSFGHWRPC